MTRHSEVKLFSTQVDGKRPTLYLARAVGGPILATATTHTGLGLGNSVVRAFVGYLPIATSARRLGSFSVSDRANCDIGLAFSGRGGLNGERPRANKRVQETYAVYR